MNSSVVRRMYAGFSLIVILFITTVILMLNGTSNIHKQMQSVSSESMPLVSLSNETSVSLLAADKSFKDFLTTRDPIQMQQAREQFSVAETKFKNTFKQLINTAQQKNTGVQQRSELAKIESAYFNEAKVAMDNYQALLTAEDEKQQAIRNFQRLYTELSVRMKEYINDQESIAVKMMAKSYFVKLEDAELITSDALASNDIALVNKAVNQNKKAVTHLNYAYRGLANQLPELKGTFDDSVKQFSAEVGQKEGILNTHFAYLTAKDALYTNISNLAQQIDKAITLLTSFNQLANQDLQNSLQQADTIYQQSLYKGIALGVVVSLLATFIGFNLATSVRTPLQNMLKILESLTSGDMTQRIETKRNTEFSRVSRHINTLADNLQKVLIQLSGASDELTEVAQNNNATAEKAKQQLLNQREQTTSVAAAMTEMEHSVVEVASSSESSLLKVQEVEAASEHGQQVMKNNLETIEQLSSRLDESVQAVSNLQKVSSEIGSILDVINNIAEQTNLLALNAAIEAARAGEQGRGFAVVADEVRILAQRTAKSTSEIEVMIANLQSSSKTTTTVIESCVEDMQQSVTQTNEANNAMVMIQNLIEEISHMSNHISQAANEQSATTTEIARSLEDISHIAENNQEAMNDIANVSQTLNELAHQQSDIVHQFKV
ncbi:methyl-accepting chemotaxis protein [Aliivibrio fischeri]|uniref:methyl-accepting chemotaxis protein n=1 Tax=Aliivibrio fischeri TaxID=668 RepID=UPI001F3278C9|nr:methyl-accepting chemotaxis protein [Aliivibrio fischeri]MCE7576285.1 methyl-accepting chemotaxis protein [Aliivibrio fischeri]MCE7588575.1 methyl-accepting chemotaxis protein [Aliivibrio fischeri]